MPIPSWLGSFVQAPCTNKRLFVIHGVRYRPQRETTAVGKLQERKLKTAVTDRNSTRRSWRGTGTTGWPILSHSIDGQASLDVPHRALHRSKSLGRILKNGRTLWAKATRRMTNDTTLPHKKEKKPLEVQLDLSIVGIVGFLSRRVDCRHDIHRR